MSEEIQEKVKLTRFSHGAGCGCKIAPQVLEKILSTNKQRTGNKNLLVGNDSNDDAAAFEIENGTVIISTTDFFMPVVDDAIDFGKIASANAISDVYAMGGKPLLAVAILGWPVNTLPAELAQQVLEGARIICDEAGVALGGGHSIDAEEPFFGLAVTGTVEKKNLKRNNTAKDGDILFITKPIGVGILSTAQKRDVIEEGDEAIMLTSMTSLNKIGEQLGTIEGVHAMTDVTGFGLLGHCIEMAKGSELSVEIDYKSVPIIEQCKKYLAERIVPDATYRNWNSYSADTQFEQGVNVMEAFSILPDPQTNGGLLIAVHPDSVNVVQALLKVHNIDCIEPIGRMIAKQDKTIIVR
jgi:selenide, water dikinase